MKAIISKFKLTWLTLLLMVSVCGYAQTATVNENSLDYLKQTCPQLTELFQEELENCHAHYVLAVDVSLSMAKYESTVLPALKAFVAALPSGDKMTVIPFAKEAYDNKIGFDVKITDETRNTMLQTLNALYPHQLTGQDRVPYMDTDIAEVQKSIMRSIQQSEDYDVNIIIYITDMMHCPANNIDRQFNSKELEEMNSLMKAANPEESQVRLFALQLPKAGKPEGYVMPTLKEMYLENWGDDAKLEVVDVPANSDAVIAQWFDLQKNRIMFTKLQAIVERENKANPLEVETKVDIDGNVDANLKWKPGKLYQKLQIDTIYIAEGSNFYMKPNKKHLNKTYEGAIDLEGLNMGKIRNNEWFFHQLQDTLHFDVQLPVEYQRELDKLLEGRPTPTANTSEYKNQRVWTFILPFWWTVGLSAALLIYIFLVIKAFIRNKKERFVGTVDLSDSRGRDIGDTINVKIGPSKTLLIGENGNSGCQVPGANWTMKVEKITPSPLLFWKRPYFQWSKKDGFVCSGSKKRGNLGRYGQAGTKKVVNLETGPESDKITHGIRIRIK